MVASFWTMGISVLHILTLLVIGDAREALVLLLLKWSELMPERLGTGQRFGGTDPSRLFLVLGILREREKKNPKHLRDSSCWTRDQKTINTRGCRTEEVKY